MIIILKNKTICRCATFLEATPTIGEGRNGCEGHSRRRSTLVSMIGNETFDDDDEDENVEQTPKEDMGYANRHVGTLVVPKFDFAQILVT